VALIPPWFYYTVFFAYVTTILYGQIEKRAKKLNTPALKQLLPPQAIFCLRLCALCAILQADYAPLLTVRLCRVKRGGRNGTTQRVEKTRRNPKWPLFP
jgi:hypothetical protein